MKKIEKGLMPLLNSKVEDELKRQPYTKIKDLRQFLVEIISNAEEKGNVSHDEALGGKYFLLVQSDRGGTITKFYVVVINEVLVHGQTVNSVHVYCAFEDPDYIENV